MAQAMNITRQVKDFYQKEQEDNAKLWQDVLEKTKNGVPSDVLAKVRGLIQAEKKSKIIPFPTNRVMQLGKVQLLAAASQQLGNWFSQPLVFSSAGFLVDVRRIKGKDNDVDVYFHAIDGKNALMESLFSGFKGRSIKITFSINGVKLLSADIYVDQSAHIAEGSGVVYDADVDTNKGDLELNVELDD